LIRAFLYLLIALRMSKAAADQDFLLFVFGSTVPSDNFWHRPTAPQADIIFIEAAIPNAWRKYGTDRFFCAIRHHRFP